MNFGAFHTGLSLGDVFDGHRTRAAIDVQDVVPAGGHTASMMPESMPIPQVNR